MTETTETTGQVEPRRIELRVNGEARSVPAGLTVDALLGELGLGERRVAVAVNRDVVPRGERGERVLAEGDRVEILEAVGGG